MRYRFGDLLLAFRSSGSRDRQLECVARVDFIRILNLIEEKYLGDILADLSGRRGKVLGQEMYGKDIVMVKAQVPQAEILQYALQLKALTSSTGAFETEFDHYSPLGVKETEALAKEYQEHRKEGLHE